MSQHSQPKPGDLDAILKGLIDNPEDLDTVKTTLMGRLRGAGLDTSDRMPQRRIDDDDDLFDNVPV